MMALGFTNVIIVFVVIATLQVRYAESDPPVGSKGFALEVGAIVLFCFALLFTLTAMWGISRTQKRSRRLRNFSKYELALRERFGRDLEE